MFALQSVEVDSLLDHSSLPAHRHERDIAPSPNNGQHYCLDEWSGASEGSIAF